MKSIPFITNLLQLINKLKKVVYFSQYDDFTIADYFREQGARIGENNRIGIRSLGTEPYLISIANHCTIASNVCFLTHDGGAWVFTEESPCLQKFGPIHIKNNCFIGVSAIIMGNTTIGPNAIVGAGSIVTKDVPPNTVVAGNPARVISSLEDYRQKVIRIWEQQKPPGYFHDLQNGGSHPPASIQKLKYRDMNLLKTHLIKIFMK